LVEEAWSKREELFKARGYSFRPRLQKGWTPSWVDTDKSALQSEDSHMLRTHLVDAFTDDGRVVCIKQVGRNEEEVRIARMLGSDESRPDPKNHCISVIEVIDDPEDDTKSYLVMPFLRSADNPPFDFVKEIIDFVDQILEGLVYLHEKGVAHRDCVMHNIMMDADAMYPDGFHPVKTMHKRDFSGWATYIPRSVAGVRYYFADFGISVHIPEEETDRLVTGQLGRDQDPPELARHTPYDPFKLDIFIIGNMFKKEFQDKYTNVQFLGPLILWMTDMEPDRRPTAEAALREWSELRKSISTVHGEWRPRPSDEHPLATFVLDVVSLYQLSMNLAKACVQGLYGRQST